MNGLTNLPDLDAIHFLFPMLLRMLDEIFGKFMLEAKILFL
jgi:hypothetical protein